MTDPITTILEEVEALVKAFEKQRKNLVDKLKPSFHDIFLPYLERNPQVAELYFTAYTPYFNDGEECTFSVGELYGTTEDDDEFGDNYGPKYKDVIKFLETGKVNKELKTYVESYTKPSYDYGYYGHGFGRERPMKPAKYATLEDAFKGQYSGLANSSIEELKALAVAQEEFGALRSIMSRIPDDIIRDLFGDHIRVVITRDGVEVEDYDHE